MSCKPFGFGLCDFKVDSLCLCLSVLVSVLATHIHAHTHAHTHTHTHAHTELPNYKEIKPHFYYSCCYVDDDVTDGHSLRFVVHAVSPG